MYKELNIDDIEIIKQCHLIKRSVPKEKLSDWLETVCVTFGFFRCVATETSTVMLKKLTKFRGHDQKTIIQLKDEFVM